MTDTLIFAIGVVVTAITVTAVLLVGRAEAEDPAMNRTVKAMDGR